MVDVWIMAHSAGRRESLRSCCAGDSGIHVAGVAATFPFLRSLMSETQADIALIELTPDMPSAAATDWLFELMESTPIVLLSPDPDPAILNRIRRAGTGGFLQSNAPCEQIVQAIKAVAAGLVVFDGGLAPQPSSAEEAMLEPLTPREAEVLQLLADGLGNKEIASGLGISEHTIKFHIRSILGKLGAASRTEAVARGLRSGLIEL
jgi:two-component system, NarL family, response regulator YdfI